jgi:hypothetical protein
VSDVTLLLTFPVAEEEKESFPLTASPQNEPLVVPLATPRPIEQTQPQPQS